MLAHFKHGSWLLSSLYSRSRGHRLEDEVVVVGEAEPGEDDLPEEVQDGGDDPQQAELENYFWKQFAPAEPLRLTADAELEVEAVVGPGQPGQFSLVEDNRGCALIGREVDSVATPALWCHKDSAQGKL